MSNQLVSAAIAGLIGAAAAAAVLAVGPQFRGVGKKMVHAEIHLDQVGGSCLIQTSPQTLEAFKRETIQWTIVDRCGVTLTNDVQVTFADNPLDSSCVPRGRKKITCTVNPSAGFRSYKYSVSATGATTEDPDLELVQ